MRDVLAAVAPVTAASIKPPRSASDPADAEAATGVVWPGQIRELYALCDGQENAGYGAAGLIFPRQPMFSLTTIVDEHALMVDIGREIVNGEIDYYGGDYDAVTQSRSEAAVVANVFLPGYLPFAGEDGNFYYCDTRSGLASGCVRLYDSESADAASVVAPSLALFLHDVTQAIRTFSPLGNWTPLVEDGQLYWD